MKRYDFVTVGNYTKDTIVSAAGTRYVDGGGYNYAAHAARLLGLRVAAVTRRAAGTPTSPRRSLPRALTSTLSTHPVRR